MIKLLSAYGASALVFLILDGLWLTFVGGKLYRPLIGDILAPKVNLTAAVAFYLIYIFGITALAIAPAIREDSMMRALTNGAILGFVAYATYDLTNQATLKVWPLRVTLADIGWGTFLTACAAAAGFAAYRWTESRLS